MGAISPFEIVIRWLQLLVSIAFPIALVIILWSARNDFHRWVEHQVDRDRSEDTMEAEIQEFID